MVVILLVVVVIKCIPKNKLPYCLGGTRGRETFVCIAKYAQWCKLNGIPPILTKEQLSNMTKEEAVKETCNKLGIKEKDLKPF